jgi:hypothetical protein
MVGNEGRLAALTAATTNNSINTNASQFTPVWNLDGLGQSQSQTTQQQQQSASATANFPDVASTTIPPPCPFLSG